MHIVMLVLIPLVAVASLAFWLIVWARTRGVAARLEDGSTFPTKSLAAAERAALYRAIYKPGSKTEVIAEGEVVRTFTSVQ